jgi:lambda repressor-like predicted transcriptional regulator
LDYKINKQGVSLKNLTTENSLISERFENIMKRKIVGENSVKNKRNRK